ncbi:hypothetical protein [Halomonas sp. YLGW01]|uniref:hypothetical protein n=1 Tax=Halomonas sp. YLGW01 TaxID=2773308 RepID=UPI00177B1C9B|nr:hypothetical protein [Halomonas sp. YLGW01]
MAISPWHLLSVIRCDDVAALLADFDPAVPTVDSYTGRLYDEWRRVLVEEAQAGHLSPAKVFVGDDEVQQYTDALVPQPIIHTWRKIHPSKNDWRYHSYAEIRLSFDRKELYRWLKQAVPAAEIPEALRLIPNTQAPAAPQDKPLHHKRRQTYLKLIEGLALEVLGGEMPDEPYKAAVMLQQVLQRHGLKLDDEPIAKTVQEILAAREERESDPF